MKSLGFRPSVEVEELADAGLLVLFVLGVVSYV